ncbi:stabilizer of axonemal microtubules 1-like [Myripristis murdjan]|uniref:stabilizer of axonemal microtubules 1-like n=1 Tax=Myripristis murdjan TaxID=586833 RepID=UPI0011762D47|nr:stabilizer of axonemal microtubules 1 [Myripristis murdjan]
MDAQTTKTIFQSVYKDDFRPWNVQRRQPYRLCDNLKLNKGTFETTTTSKDSYSHKHLVNITENFKPVPQIKETHPFDSTTNCRSQYVTFPVQLRKPRDNPAYQPNSTPLTRVIGSHEDYKHLPTEPAKSFKPKVSWARNPTVFEATSEFSDKFKTWPLGTKFHHKPEEYRPPEGRMAFLSTTHADYTVHEGQRSKSARPPIQTWVKDKGPFKAKSIMKEDYKIWSAMRRSPIIHKEEWEIPRGAFEKTTTSRSAYTPKTVHRAVSCKPAPRPPSPKSLLEKTTVYRSSYTAKEMPRCPVQCHASAGIQHKSTGVEGRQLYQIISDTGVTQPYGGTEEKPSQSHQRIPCMVSSRTTRAS